MRLRALAAAALPGPLLVLGACGATGTEGPGHAPKDVATTTAAPVAPVTPARRAASVARPQRPVAVVLPGEVVVPVRRATTVGGGLLDVPADIGTAGWWDGGARIGDPFGSTLVAAHVDSAARGLGPFAGLLGLTGGERVRLVSHALAQDFEVTSLRLVPQGPLSARSAMFDPGGPRRLTLVTCAPPYVRTRGGYQNLAVVTAVPVSPPRRVPPR